MPTVTRRVFLKNEDMEPLANVVIELFDTKTSRVLARATTDAQGIASFSNVTVATDAYWFRPLLTRVSGRWGDMTLNGALHLEAEREIPVRLEEPEKKEEEEKPKRPEDVLGGEESDVCLIVVKENGESWRLESGTWSEIGTIAAGTDFTGYAFRHGGYQGKSFAVTPDDQSLAMSIDDGVTYTKISDAGDGVLDWAYDGSRIWYVHFSGIKYSDDDGGSWSSAHAFSVSIAAMALSGSRIVVAHTDDAGDFEPACTISENDGGSWTTTVISSALPNSPRNPYLFGHAIHTCITGNGYIYIYWFEESANAVSSNRHVAMYSTDGTTWAATGMNVLQASAGSEEEIWSRGLHAVTSSSSGSTGFVAVRSSVVTRGLDSSAGTVTNFSQPHSALCIGSAYDPDNDILYLLYEDGEVWKVTVPLSTGWSSPEQLEAFPSPFNGDTDCLAICTTAPV